MSNPRPPASELLPLLAEAFPQTFFADPKQVQPLKINIHRDLNDWRKAQALPAEIGLLPLRRFMHWYTQRTAYLKALARGEGRVDLTGAEVDSDIPEAIREQARQEIARRQALKTGTASLRKTAPANRAAAWLPRLAAAFPQTFFADPKQVRPLKVFLYRDLLRLAKAGALPEGIDRAALKAFLHWYGRRTAYLNAVARGLGRLDLTGTVVTTTIPDALRQQARAEVQRRQANRAAQAAAVVAASPPPAPALTPDSIPYALEDLYAMAIDAKLEVTLKFSTLPKAKAAGQGTMAFALKTPDGQFVTVEVSSKAWNKLVKTAEDWPSWIAALTGTMGERTEQGFALENPGLQVFERKPKAPAEAASPLAEALSAALAAVSPVDVAPAPAVAEPAEAVPVPVTTTAADPDPARRKPVLSLKSRKTTP